MRMPGYTADVSVRLPVGHYSRTFSSPVAKEMIAPQRDAVVVYDSWYGTETEVGSGPVSAETKGSGSGVASGGGTSSDSTGLPGVDCLIECLRTSIACQRNCRSEPPGDREICQQNCTRFFRACASTCRPSLGLGYGAIYPT